MLRAHRQYYCKQPKDIPENQEQQVSVTQKRKSPTYDLNGPPMRKATKEEVECLKEIYMHSPEWSDLESFRKAFPVTTQNALFILLEYRKGKTPQN